MKKFLLLGAALTLMSTGAFAKEIHVKVSGMVCSMCAQGIEKKFKADASVKDVKVNLDDKLVKIHTHEGKDIEDTIIKKHITEAGYNVAEITRQQDR